MRNRPSRPGLTPMRGPYLVRNPLLYAWLRAIDSMHKVDGRPAQPLTHAPDRMLVCVGGHRGDAVISTALLASIQTALPDVRIGILTGSWNAEVFESHPRVARVHRMDHWQWNRSGGLATRWRTARTTEAQARSEIEGVGYDAALDLSPYYPNFARTLWSARIPVRAGFISGGHGGLYTRPLRWRPGRHVTEDHLELLASVIRNVDKMPRSYELPPHTDDVTRRVDARLASVGIAVDEYAVLHAGAGAMRKEWTVAKWADVARQLCAEGLQVVLTGRGERECEAARSIVRLAPGVVSLCDQLSWNEFRRVIARARVVVSVDTVAVHVAAAEGTPCVSIMTAIDNIHRWRPRDGRALVVTRDVPCAPCYRSRGCREMSCIQDVEAMEVVAAARSSLRMPART